MKSGVDEPPGVQNFSSCPSRMPPARSSSSRNVMPSGASYCPGRLMCPDSENSLKPGDFSLPIERNHLAPLRMIGGTLAIDSTLLMTVGLE